MIRHMIGMRMADEYQLLLSFLGIEPEAQVREINPAVLKLKIERRHDAV